ncbi:rRNA maturation RNase YbeY [Patescibacteria group bacterium]|nr:rRNA maturation RNase YbeY [Patescibacteria group bacterium]
MAESTFAITQTTKGKLPRLPFEHIKNNILGKRYILSVVFVGDMRAKALNKKYRKKNSVPNVLSFPLEKHEGEIFINPNKARKDAHLFDMNTTNFIGYLFIHGLLHLKGLEHGSTMDTAENKACKKFAITLNRTRRSI